MSDQVHTGIIVRTCSDRGYARRVHSDAEAL